MAAVNIDGWRPALRRTDAVYMRGTTSSTKRCGKGHVLMLRGAEHENAETPKPTRSPYYGENTVGLRYFCLFKTFLTAPQRRPLALGADGFARRFLVHRCKPAGRCIPLSSASDHSGTPPICSLRERLALAAAAAARPGTHRQTCLRVTLPCARCRQLRRCQKKGTRNPFPWWPSRRPCSQARLGVRASRVQAGRLCGIVWRQRSMSHSLSQSSHAPHPLPDPRALPSRHCAEGDARGGGQPAGGAGAQHAAARQPHPPGVFRVAGSVGVGE